MTPTSVPDITSQPGPGISAHTRTLRSTGSNPRGPLSSLRLALLLFLAFAAPFAHAHLGSKDVFEQISAGPYQLFVTIRPPNVIPGIATVEVRTSGPAVSRMSITPIPLTGEASKHPPASDPMQPSTADPAFFTGSLWLMSPGSWQVRIQLDGATGPAGATGTQTASVPVPAMPLSILPMQRPLGLTLAVLGLFLVLSMAGIVAAAVREARLAPGAAPSPDRRRRALLATAASLAVMAVFILAGDKWWNVEAAGYANAVYRPLTLSPTLSGSTLDLHITPFVDPDRPLRSRPATDLLPDHGHLMHLYAIRMPGMDAAFHLHPTPVFRDAAAPGDLRLSLPSMPPGDYKLFGDIVHSNGFPETLTANLTIPAGLPPAPLAPEDASAFPEPLNGVERAQSSSPFPATSVASRGGTLGSAYQLPDDYTMLWDRPAEITASTGYAFRFHLLDPAGRPAEDIEPYLGMAGHAAFVKADASTFAHTHPEGSAAMQAMDLANPGSMAGMNMSDTATAITSAAHEPISSTVTFPYGFPSPGRYRIFVQMKHGTTVETGVFDAEAK